MGAMKARSTRTVSGCSESARLSGLEVAEGGCSGCCSGRSVCRGSGSGKGRRLEGSIVCSSSARGRERVSVRMVWEKMGSETGEHKGAGQSRE
eukprot:2507173-Rhodomonas_salina.2